MGTKVGGRKRSAPTWSRLNRSDLLAFDDAAKKAVLFAMDNGGVGRITRNGHALLRSPNGQTMSVTPKSNKSKQIVALNIRRLFPEVADQIADDIPAVSDTTTRKEPPAMPTATAANATRYECTNARCDKTFATEGARYSHVTTDHLVCRHPGCLWSTDSAQGRAAHFRVVHEGFKPRTVGKERRLAAEAATTAGPAGPEAKKRTGMSREEAGRLGGLAKQAKIRAEKETARRELEAMIVGGQVDTEPEVIVTPKQLAQMHTAEGDVQVTVPVPLQDLLDRLDRIETRLAEPDGVAARLDAWINDEREKMQAAIDLRDSRIAKAEAAMDDAQAKLSLLREALDA